MRIRLWEKLGASPDFVWNGKDEDDRPLSKKEMRAGIKGAGGRPRLANPKKTTTIRLNAEVLDFFKAQGKEMAVNTGS